MARYPRQDDPKGKNVIPSVTEIIGDCTDGTPWAIPYGANQACDWIIENCAKSIDFVGDDCLIVYEDELRRKRKDEKDYPNNARYAHKHHSQKALDIGSEVHNAIELFLKDKISSVSTGEELVGMMFCDQARYAFIAFLDWENEHNLKPISVEQTVYGDVDGYCWAGTMDIECYLNDKRTVIDFKTSKDFYWDSMGPQIAAYKSLTDVTHCGILRLDKESGMPFYRDRTKYYERDLKIFKHMVRIYMLRHPKIAKGCFNG